MAAEGQSPDPSPSSTLSPVICSKCNECYNDPRILSCLHVFCFLCLESSINHIQVANNDSGSISSSEITICPSCGAKTPRPPSLLPRHVHLHKASSIARFKTPSRQTCGTCKKEEELVKYCEQCDGGSGVCSNCVDVHKNIIIFKDHNLIVAPNFDSLSSPFEVHCTAHENETLKHYCDDCNEMVCNECVVHEHKNHPYSSLGDALSKETTELSKVVDKLKKSTPKVMEASTKVKQSLTNLSDSKDNVEQIVNEKFDHLASLVEKRRKEVLEKLGNVTTAKNKILQQQSEQLDQLCTKLEHVVSICDEASEFHTASEFLSISGFLCGASNGLMKEVTEVNLQPVICSEMCCDWDENNDKEIVATLSSRQYGSIADSTTFLVDVENPILPIGAFYKSACVVALHATDSKGERVGEKDIRAWLTSDKEGKKKLVNAKVTHKKGHNFKLKIKPPNIREQYLHVEVCEATIGPPFILNIRSYTDMKKSLWVAKTNYPHPAYIHVSSKGRLYCTFDVGTISVCDSNDGALIYNISIDKLGVSRPRGIAVDEENEVMFIASYENHKVVKAKLDGKEVKLISDQVEFNGPMGLCLDKKAGLLYVADYGKKRVVILNSSNLSYIDAIQCDSNVWNIAIDKLTGNIYVGQSYGIIEVFSSSRERDFKFKLDSSIIVGDIAFTATGNCIIGDHSNPGKIMVLGRPKNHHIDIHHRIGNFNYPLGVAVDQSGHIYFAVWNENSIYKF